MGDLAHISSHRNDNLQCSATIAAFASRIAPFSLASGYAADIIYYQFPWDFT